MSLSAAHGSIAVIGATGRTGILCVQSVLEAGYSCNAICRSQDKAYNIFTVVPKSQRNLLSIKEVKNIEDSTAIKEAIKGCSAVIFAACGVSFLGIFSNNHIFNIKSVLTPLSSKQIGLEDQNMSTLAELLPLLKLLKCSEPKTLSYRHQNLSLFLRLASLVLTGPYILCLIPSEDV